MATGPPGGAGEPRDLEADLEAERTAKDHWRRVAQQRSAAFDDLRRHPAVRALLALDRGLDRFRRPIAGATERLRALVDRSSLIVRAVGNVSSRRMAELESTVARLPAPPTPRLRASLVVVGSPLLPSLPGAQDVETTEVPAVDLGRDTVVAVRRALDAAEGDLVGLILATTTPLDAAWLARLAAAMDDGVAAATPVLVHPARPRSRATPHDGRVRSAGLSIEVTSERIPVAPAAGAGATAQPGGPTADVDAASAACVLVDRNAYEQAGGLPVADDLDVAVVELCVRLRARGGRIVVEPSAVMVDHRPVRTKRDLLGPIDPNSSSWRGAIDRCGPALLRSVSPMSAGLLRFVITVAAPSAQAAEQWGDWHLATGLAAGLRRLGHDVLLQTIDRVDDPASRVGDVHLVVRGMKPVRRTVGQRHVLWIVSHPELIDDHELAAADLLLVASPKFADEVRSRVATPVEVLLQATDHHRFHPRPPDRARAHEVVVVANTRAVLRPAVADALAGGVRPSIYGDGWRDLVDPQLVVADHVDNDELPTVYSSAGVVLNDHWRTMQRWGFVSNRLYDVLACGTPVISDPVPGLAELFDGGVLEFHTPAELRQLVDEVLTDPEAARQRAARGRAAVLAAHTFDHRAQELVAALSRIRRQNPAGRNSS